MKVEKQMKQKKNMKKIMKKSPFFENKEGKK